MATLQPGSTGTSVKIVQQGLQLLGYTITVDGDYGNGTAAIVMKFQQNNGLSADGIAGPMTQAALSTLVNNIVQGIDISHLNGPVNYSTLAQDGISFVFCKASQGIGFTDPVFQTNYEQLTSANIIMAPYHFVEFENSPAQAQADNFFKCNVDFTQQGILPPVIDIEWQANDALNQYITNNRAACVQLISDWLSIVATKIGRNPIIYTNANFWHDFLGNPAGFGQYPLWIADYSGSKPPVPPGWNNYTIWQFTGTGGISSVQGQVDRDTFNGPLSALKSMANF